MTATLETLTPGELARYHRQLLLPELGPSGQRKLKEASVLFVGSGGLGSPGAVYLAAAGVGRIGLVDFDVVEISNLHRQVIYRTGDLGSAKADVAARHLAALNPEVKVEPHQVRLAEGNVRSVVSGYDLVVDGADNFPTRYLVNDACVELGKPDVWAAIYRFEGQVSVFDARRGPCYRCLFPSPPPAGLVPSCAEGGVLGVLPGVVGMLQATEAIKLILGLGDPLIGRVLLYSALSAGFNAIGLDKDPDCPACGANPWKASEEIASGGPGLTQIGTPLARQPSFSCASGAGGASDWTIAPAELESRLSTGANLNLVDCREPFERVICNITSSVSIPLDDLPDRFGEIDATAETVVYCHHGPRSAKAVAYLKQAGIERARYLDGGIDAWALLVEPGMARY